MQREQRKAEARANRDALRDKTQKAKDDLFNGHKREIAKSTTRDTKQKKGAEEEVKVHKKDRNNNGGVYDDSELRALIAALESRLNSASIDAECGEGSVTVTLNI